MIKSAAFWWAITWLGFGTFIIRGVFVFLGERLKMSERVKEILSFIPAAVLPAMTILMVFFHQGDSQFFMGKERLVVLCLAIAVHYLYQNLFLTIIVGLISLPLVAFF